MDGNFKRITFKSQNYTNLEKMNEFVLLSTKMRYFSCMIIREILEENALEKFCGLFPKWEKWWKFIFDRIDSFCKTVEDIYEPVKNIQNAKEFAMAVNKKTTSKELIALVFLLRRTGAVSFKTVLGGEEVNGDKI